MQISEIRKFVDDKKAQKSLLQKQLGTQRIFIGQKKKEKEDTEKARWLLSEASKLTQMNVKNQIESLVTMAINSVFDKDYRFICDFEIKRNKSECFLRIVQGDSEPFDLKGNVGGGLVDVTSLALRIVLWSMQKPRTRNVLILDEPGRYTGALSVKFGQMVKEISKELKLQILMVTHDSALAEISDRTWEVRHNGVFSEVKQLGEPERKTVKRRK